MSTYRPSNIKTAATVQHLRPAGLLCTFCECRGLSCVRQAELAFLPAAVVADQWVVGLLDVHIITNTEHVTGSLDTPQWERTPPLLTDSHHTSTGITKDLEYDLLHSKQDCRQQLKVMFGQTPWKLYIYHWRLSREWEGSLILLMLLWLHRNREPY